MAEQAIEFDNVTKVFKSRTLKNTLLRRPYKIVTALDDISFAIHSGQVFGLLGSNGAGKTTLVKLVAGLLSADRGTVSVFGEEVGDANLERMLLNVGMVTNNDRTFYWRLTGRHNLHFFAVLNNMNVAQQKYRVGRLLEQLDLEEIADRPFMTYSTGQKQRFAIARSLLNDPKILLFDEATANLDPISAKNLLNYVKEKLVREKRHTILWCTHNLAEAERICDNIVILHQGRLVTQGALAEIQARKRGATTFEFIVSQWQPAVNDSLIQLIEKTANLNDGLTAVTIRCRQEEVHEVIASFVAKGILIQSCTRTTMRLEEIFESEINHVTHHMAGHG